MKSSRMRTPRKWLGGLIALCALLLTAVPSTAQFAPHERWENGITESWWFASNINGEDAVNAQELWRRIGGERESPGSSEWAGDYFTGSEVHGTYLRWSSQIGYVMADVDKCAATVMRLSYGRVSVSSELIEFVPERTSPAAEAHSGRGRHTARPMPTRLIPARWRSFYYLIPEQRIEEFGDYVAGLGERDVLLDEFFSKTVSAARPESSAEVPIVPARYAHLIKRPIEAQIIAVGRSYFRRSNNQWRELVIPVRINAGSENGVRRGMTLHVRDSENNELVEVTRIGLRSSQGIVVRDSADRSYPPITVSWRLTTSPRYP